MYVRLRRQSSHLHSCMSAIYFLGVLLWIIVFSWDQSVNAETIPIKKIDDNPGQYVNEIVTVEGSVTELEGEPGTPVKHYVLKGDDETTLRVRIKPELEKPKLNVNYKVTGLLLAENGGQIFLAETSRTLLLGESAMKRPTQTLPTESKATQRKGAASPRETRTAKPRKYRPPEPKSITTIRKWLYILIITTTTLLIALIIILSIILKKRQAVKLSARPIQETIKIDPSKGKVEIPETDQGTVKLLPGYFEITSGVEGGGKFFIYASETTIGRGDKTGRDRISFPDDYASVSRSQAKLYYMGGKYTIKNLADPITKNATAVNGESLPLEGSKTLEDGDKISFGEVEITYHAKR